MTNRFTELVGCRLPLQQAGMTRVTTPSLVAAVSEAGGLGMLGIGRPTRAAALAQLDEVLALTSRPVGATFIVRFLDGGVLETIAERLPVVELFWGWPEPDLVLPGVISGWQVGTVDEARAAVDAGCRYVVAQGVEAGGHVRGTVPLAELLPAVLDAVDVPVVAAGGIATAADVRRVLALGADAVRVGTRFVATDESDAHDRYVELLAGATGEDTVLTEAFGVGWPDAPHRVLASALAAAEASTSEVVARMTMPDGSVNEIPRFGTTPPNRATAGELDALALYAGTGVAAVTGRERAADVVAELTAGLGDGPRSG
jgi:nitronate monooxygenase